MADSNTTILGLTKPEVGSSSDTWGTKLNADLDAVDALFGAGPVLLLTKGGTGAATAEAARSNLGLGSMALQNSNAVAVTGGSVDGAPVGATTPAAGKFTELTVDTDTLAVDKTNKRVGVKVAAPEVPLDVDGVVRSRSGGFTFPDGTTQASAAISGNGLAYSPQSSSFTAGKQCAYFLTANNIVVTLPAAPDDNTFVVIASGASVSGCSVARNGKKIMGAAEDMTLDSLNFAFKLVYYAAGGDWRIAL